MFREQYHQLNEQVTPTRNLVQDTIEKAGRYEKKYYRKVVFLRKPVIALVAICICITMALPALAATVEPIYQFMYLVSPSVAQFFMPVQKSDKDNGIEMEVISAYIHGNIAEIYITMQDLTGGRIDETTDLFDSYSINRPFDSQAHCERVGYDEEKRIATFLITIEEWGKENIVGDKITFIVREFLSHKKTYDKIEIPMDLSEVSDAKETQIVSSNGGGGSGYQEKFKNEINTTALIPSSPMPGFSVDGMDLTGIGYINGELHVQTAVKNPLENGNHGFFYLKDSKGNSIDSSYNFYFSNQYEEASERIDYCNYVFDVPRTDLTNYALYGDFVTSGMKTEGNWKVTFSLDIDKRETKK